MLPIVDIHVLLRPYYNVKVVGLSLHNWVVYQNAVRSMSSLLSKYVNHLRASETCNVARCLRCAVRCSLFFSLYIFTAPPAASKSSFTSVSFFINAGSMNCELAARHSASVIDAVCSCIVSTTLSSCRRLGVDNNPLLVCLIAAADRVCEYIRFTCLLRRWQHRLY